MYLANKAKKDLEISGQLGGEGLGEVGDGAVEVEDGRVLETVGLRDNGFDHIGMAVAAAHRSNPSKSVQISPSLLVEQVLPLPSHHVQLLPHNDNNNNASLIFPQINITRETKKNDESFD